MEGKITRSFKENPLEGEHVCSQKGISVSQIELRQLYSISGSL
jgi:hypothetical protein